MYRLRKIKDRMFLVVIFFFLVVWFVFGCIYQNIANTSNGRDYIFQSDILLRAKSEAFQKLVGIAVDIGTIQNLFTNFNTKTTLDVYDAETPILILNVNRNDLITYRPIGSNWAKYYISKLQKIGFNFASAHILEPDRAEYEPGIKILFKVYRIDIDVEDLIFNEIYLPDYKDKIVETREYIMFLNSDDDILGYNYMWSLYPDIVCILDEGYEYEELLSHSISYLDTDYCIVSNFELQKQFKYPLIDFLYFSAVTITTLGYGDILPNSTLVRSCVMIETVLGMVSIALFVASFYEWLKRINHDVR